MILYGRVSDCKNFTLLISGNRTTFFFGPMFPRQGECLSKARIHYKAFVVF